MNNGVLEFEYERFIFTRMPNIEDIKHFTESVKRLVIEYNKTSKIYFFTPLELVVMLSEMEKAEKGSLEPITVYFYENEKVARYDIAYVYWKISFTEKMYILTRLRDVANNIFKSDLKLFVLASDILKVLWDYSYNWE